MNKMKALCLCTLLSTSSTAFATIVEFETSQGSFQVNLFDQTTPITVNNFLRYVDQNSYQDSTVHRSVPNFVLQGGGFKYEGTIPLDRIETFSSIQNEPVLSNVRGTIAMAKLSNSANSATSQWYFNLKDNSVSLDATNGGYTVFGQVTTEQGMAVIDKIAALERCGEVPVVNYTSSQCSDTSVDPDESNLVTVNNIVIIDADPTTAANLSPKSNTLIDNVPTPTPNPVPEPEKSSSGSLLTSLFLMVGIVGRRYRKKR